MTRKVILIDGPRRGDVIETDAPLFVVPVVTPSPLLSFVEATPEPGFRKITYQIRQFVLFGRVIYIGTVRAFPADPDLFEALASNTAKDLVTL
jgi:hypothetical protein